MKTINFYVVGLLCLFTTGLFAQETFEEKAAAIARNIQQITKQEKDSLKAEVEAVNQLLENNEITKDEADERKQEYAEKRAANIETRVAVEQQKLDELVQDKVDGKVESKSNTTTILGIKVNHTENDSVKVEKDYNRTTSQFVFALGLNRLMTDGEIDDENFKNSSDFYEWGVALNTRIFKDNNLLHFKYGLSLQYNNLRPTNNRIFAVDGKQTVLIDDPKGRTFKTSKLRYVNLVIPAHLEFDFGAKKVNGDKTYYPVQKSVRIGIGGYAGINVKEKQKLVFDNDNGNKVKEKTKGNYHVNDFVYGVSAYVGYSSFSLYAKYDLQPVFSNNQIDQNNLSLGIRFDFN
ncbi:hypothetical protein [Flavobacterium rhizosphaerae]|uniref:Outer membrane protein beta-barrel domain-containing protein n=1 Tax=Flavobacterium rhizosphaerae TaxID=3163298 RepID=A0ABW8YZF9_9FLAO